VLARFGGAGGGRNGPDVESRSHALEDDGLKRAGHTFTASSFHGHCISKVFSAPSEFVTVVCDGNRVQIAPVEIRPWKRQAYVQRQNGFLKPWL